MSEMIYGIETATFIIVFLSAVFGVIFWYRRRQEKKEYEKLMEDPLEVHFYIPTKTLYVIKYEKQDDKDHTKDELIIPPQILKITFS